MGSFIQIDSISIDLANSIDKNSTTDTGKCEHFSIRGYVSEIRKKDWKMCWPFPLEESEDSASSLPPLDVPKFRWWCCRNCQEEVGPGSTERDDQIAGCKSDRNCSSEAPPSNIQQDPITDTVKRREIDLNNSIDDLSCGNYHEPINNEEENKAEVARGRIDDVIDLENDANHQTASVPPKVYSVFRQEVSTNETGSENNEVDDAVHPTSNRKACTVLSESTTVSDAVDITSQTTGGPPLDSAACYHKLAENIEDFVENDIQDHQLDKSTGLTRRKHRKVRLMIDLLRDNGEARTEQMTIQESPSNHCASLQTVSTSQVKVNVPGDLTNVGQSRKRKFLLDDQESKPAEMWSQNVESTVENFEGGVGTIGYSCLDTWCKDVHAEIDVQDGVKSYLGQAEIERIHAMGKKKGKRSQVVDNYLTSESHQKQQKESNKIIDDVNKFHASKNRDSGLLTQERMDNAPWKVPMTENECNLVKGKGKMPLTDGDLASLSSLKNSMLEGEKVILNIPAAKIPIHSAQCALNEKGMDEGLRLSLNSDLASEVNNKKIIHQIENQLHFSLPFQEGTSKVHQFLRDNTETNVGELCIPSKHRTDANSGNEVCCEEIAGGRNTDKTAEGLKQAGTLKNHGDQKVDKASDQMTLDDIPMEIVELMAKNQYERCLPDAENRNLLLEKSTVRRKAPITVGTSLYGKGEFSLYPEGQRAKPQGRNGKNGTVMAGEVRPSKRKSLHHASAFDGNCSDMCGLCQPQSRFGIEVSKSQKKTPSGVHFSPMHSSLPLNARNNKLNGNADRGTSNPAKLSQGGCSLHKTILQEDDEASRIWASLTPNHAPLGYDISRKVASQSTFSNNDVTSVRSGALLKHNLRRDIDLNYSNLEPTDLEKPNRDIGLGVSNRVYSEYPFPCRNNGIESRQNLKGSLDLYSNDTIPAMHLLSLMDAGIQSGMPFKHGSGEQLLKGPYLDDCNTKLEIGTKALSSGKRPSSDYCSKNYIPDKSHGCFLGGSTFGASTSSVQHNGNFVRAADVACQISSKFAKKEKLKSSNTHQLNSSKSPKSMHARGGLVKDCDTIPVYNAQKRFPSVSNVKQFNWPCLEAETSTQSKLEVRGACGTFLPKKNSSMPIQCSTNKNPADLPLPEAELYMIRGEDLKFEKASIPQARPGLLASHGRKPQRNLKRTKIKDNVKHCKSSTFQNSQGGILHAK